MSQIQKKFIKDNAVDESKILLLNGGALKARNAADTANVELLELDGSDVLKLLKRPRLDSGVAAISDDADVITKGFFDEGVTDKLGAASGIATLDVNGKLESSQVPAIAITDVFVVADIAARDALVGIEEGDVAKVTDAGAGLPRTYIYDGSSWVEIESGSDVDSVNGQIGAVVLDGSDIGLSSPVMLQSDVQAALSALEAEDLTFLKLDGTRAMTAPLAMGTFDITDAANIDALSLNVNGAAATSIVSATSITLDAPIVEVATSLTTEKVEGGLYSLESGVGLSLTDVSSVVSVGAGAAILSGDTLAFSSGAVSGLAALIGADPADKAAPKGYVDQEVLTEKNRAEAAEGVLQGLIDALEASSVEFVQEKFILSAGDITNGYIDLANLAIAASINAYVDRLAIHATDDYTLSTVGGVTRVTFAGSLVTVGQEKLSAGDVVRVKYAKVAIV